jgi:hypothetical protein
MRNDYFTDKSDTHSHLSTHKSPLIYRRSRQHRLPRGSSSLDVAYAVDRVALGVFDSRSHPNDPVPCSLFATEGHVNAQRA